MFFCLLLFRILPGRDGYTDAPGGASNPTRDV